MSKKQVPELKKVKIDDHIKTSKKGNGAATPGKRGRPRKNHGLGEATNNDFGNNNPSPSSTVGETVTENIDAIESAKIQPVYDTTEEAKGFLRAPFDLAAGMTGIGGLALYPAQLDAMAPSFKIVYDKRIAPALGDNADIIAFAVVASGVIFEKVGVWRNEKAKHAPESQPNKTDSSGYPSIPTTHKPQATQ